MVKRLNLKAKYLDSSPVPLELRQRRFFAQRKSAVPILFRTKEIGKIISTQSASQPTLTTSHFPPHLRIVSFDCDRGISLEWADRLYSNPLCSRVFLLFGFDFHYLRTCHRFPNDACGTCPTLKTVRTADLFIRIVLNITKIPLRLTIGPFLFRRSSTLSLPFQAVALMPDYSRKSENSRPHSIARHVHSQHNHLLLESSC